MALLRLEFRAALLAQEDRAMALGRTAESLVVPATDALLAGQVEEATAVVARNAEIDAAVFTAETEVHELIGLQSPMAEDLRLLLGLMHALRSIERIGDYAGNIAKLAPHVQPAAADADLAAQMRELALRAQRAVRTSLDCFGRRAIDGVAQVEDVEGDIDQLHAGVIERLMAYAPSGPPAMTWAIRMIQAARHMERIGDHAVEVAEQGAYVVTGHRKPPTGSACVVT